MLRLYDAGSGQPETLRPARAGELRTWVAGRPPARPGSLRPALVADLVRRVVERHHLQVSAWHQAPGGPEQALRAAWDGLNIYPAEFSDRPPDLLDVAIARAGDQDGAAATYRVQPGETEPETADAAGLDPLAIRLAFLKVHYREPAVLTRDILELTDRTLTELRGQVADWALSPSKAMSPKYVGDVLGAFDDDLDTPAALRMLAALAGDPGIPPGSRFETFAHLDRLLGLDLAREVGR